MGGCPVKVTQNRLDIMATETITIGGVEFDVKDPISVQFRDFELRRTASEHRVLQGEVPRPDIISFLEYNTVGYWWVIAAINGIIDPYEMPEQDLLRVPRLLDYFDWFREQKGT